MFCVLKSSAKYVQECLKRSRIFLREMRLVNTSQNCKEWFGLVLFPPIIFFLFSSPPLLC